MSEDNAKMIVNGAYNAGIIGGLTFANAFVMKKFLKWKPANLNQLDAEDFMKLTGGIMISTMTFNYMVKQGWIPDKIMPDEQNTQKQVKKNNLSDLFGFTEIIFIKIKKRP